MSMQKLTFRGVSMQAKKFTGFAFTTIFLLTANSLSAQEVSGLDIMKLVDDLQRQSNDSSFNKMQLSSCKFGTKDRRIICADKPRVKALESVVKSYGPNLEDTKNITITLEPASERGIGMLSFNYDDPAKENETWLYLSALGRVKRIATGDSDEDTEPASLFGSEFTTEDTETGKISDYTYRILEDTLVAGRSVWKIEAIPGKERSKKTRYSRQIHYIDKERYVALRSELYDRYNKEVKRLIASRVELVNGNWVARSLTMMNLITNRLSNMALVEINTGLDIDDDFLTQRTLTDVAFREAELDKLREQVQ
jgi:hypothetical protein